MQVKCTKEEKVRPIKQRGEDLNNKLDLVRSQLVATRNMRERTLSVSSIDSEKTNMFFRKDSSGSK